MRAVNRQQRFPRERLVETANIIMPTYTIANETHGQTRNSDKLKKTEIVLIVCAKHEKSPSKRRLEL